MNFNYNFEVRTIYRNDSSVHCIIALGFTTIYFLQKSNFLIRFSQSRQFVPFPMFSFLRWLRNAFHFETCMSQRSFLVIPNC